MASGSCFLVVVHGLLITVASLIAERGLWDTWAHSCGSPALEHRFNSPDTQA